MGLLGKEEGRKGGREGEREREVERELGWGEEGKRVGGHRTCINVLRYSVLHSWFQNRVVLSFQCKIRSVWTQLLVTCTDL